MLKFQQVQVTLNHCPPFPNPRILDTYITPPAKRRKVIDISNEMIERGVRGNADIKEDTKKMNVNITEFVN